MEEIKALHNLNIEWGCITNLMDRICVIESEIEGGWPELVDMVADAVSEEGENKDPASAFFNLYQFLWRLYYRIKADPVPKEFNHTVVHNPGKTWDEGYDIYNYNYKTYKWARSRGFGMGISNNVLFIPKEKLNAQELRSFEKKVSS